MRLQNRGAIVVGGTSGMGEATARLFAKEGAKVTIAGRSAADETLKMIRDSGGEAIFVRTDISRSDDIKALFETHMKAYGRLDVLFNNAAYEGAMQSIVDTSEAEFDKTVATNFRGVFVACQLAVPIMTAAGGGSIINVTAASSHDGLAWPYLGAYIGSKGAVVSFTRALAVELAGTGIRVNSLSPGLIDTPMLRKSVDNQPDPASIYHGFAQLQLLRRIGTGDEIASAALFLASDDSSYVMGVDLLVDGGLVLGSAPNFTGTRP